jgi:hypothetical protein
VHEYVTEQLVAMGINVVDPLPLFHATSTSSAQAIRSSGVLKAPVYLATSSSIGEDNPPEGTPGQADVEVLKVEVPLETDLDVVRAWPWGTNPFDSSHLPERLELLSKSDITLAGPPVSVPRPWRSR